MLIEFSAENFRSIKDRITFSMLTARGNSKEYNLIKVKKCPNVKRLLKSCVIYGANASGKTNVIVALSVIKKMVKYSKDMNRGDTFYEYDPFILDIENENKPTFFEINFIKNSKEYKYSFSYNKDRIISEELSYQIKNEEVFFFKRKDKEFEPFTDPEDLNFLFRHTGENVLFLSKANNEYEPFGEIFEWFSKSLNPIGPTSNFYDINTLDFMLKSNENKAKVLNLLTYADFDISNIVGEIKKIYVSDLRAKEQQILSLIDDKSINENITLSHPEIKFVHTRNDGSEVLTDFDEFESEGTKRFFCMSGPWLDALTEEYQLLVVDELDVKLHPDLVKYLINIFHDPEINKCNSQLIFTTHNTHILSTDFFRRDQIWFTEKEREQKNTKLFSLHDYEKRNDRSIEKAYFMGRYGGLPELTYGRL